MTTPADVTRLEAQLRELRGNSFAGAACATTRRMGANLWTRSRSTVAKMQTAYRADEDAKRQPVIARLERKLERAKAQVAAAAKQKAAGALQIPAAIRAELDAGALFVVNHSAGKDSQAMLALLRQVVPAERLVVVHAILPEVEWAGVLEHIEATIGDLPLVTVQAGKTLLGMAEARGKFPSPSQRQCTSDLKRDPIAKWVRQHSKASGELRIVQCLGLRAEESSSRARQAVVKTDKRLSKAGRQVTTWLPIHHLTVEEVFATIAAAGQEPHFAYSLGMTRLSCAFCIMASRADLTIAAQHNPELYRRYVELERRLGFTLSPSRKTLEEITGIAAEVDRGDEAVATWLEAIAGAEELEDELEAVDLVEILVKTRTREQGLAALMRFKDRALGWSEAVHVLPITHRTGGIHQMSGRSLLVSYAAPRQVEQAVAIVNADPERILILDNGAFTAWTQGRQLDEAYWAGFYSWAQAILDRCPGAVAVCPDVIGGTTAENQALIDACPIDKARRMVVWHLDEDLEQLARLAAAESYVAFGSCGDFAVLGTPAWDARINDAFDTLDTVEHDLGRRPKVHMMRGLGQLQRGAAWNGRRFDSADSSNVARNHCRYKGEAWHIARFAERIESRIPRGWSAAEAAAAEALLAEQAELVAGDQVETSTTPATLDTKGPTMTRMIPVRRTSASRHSLDEGLTRSSHVAIFPTTDNCLSLQIRSEGRIALHGSTRYFVASQAAIDVDQARAIRDSLSAWIDTRLAAASRPAPSLTGGPKIPPALADQVVDDLRDSVARLEAELADRSPPDDALFYARQLHDQASRLLRALEAERPEIAADAKARVAQLAAASARRIKAAGETC